MTTRTSYPSAALGDVLSRDLVGFRQETAGTLTVLPTASTTLMVQLGASFRGMPAAFVAGLATSARTAEPEGPIECLDVKLTPMGLWRLLGVPMHELADRAVALDDLVGAAAAGRLLEQLAGAPAWPDRFAAVEGFLVGRVRPVDDRQRALTWCWAQIRRCGGRIPAQRLADELGWSHRRVDRLFRERVGVGPKMAARLVRLERTLGLLAARPGLPLAEAAVAAGFFDQAHLTNELVALVGRTPGRFRRSG